MPDSPDREDRLRYHLHRALVGRDRPRYEPDRVHASTVTQEDPQFCPREWALYDLTGDRPRAPEITAASQVTYDVGHMYQDLVTGWFGKLAVGHWSCLGCGSVHEFTRRPTCCERGYRYVEVRFTSRVSGVSCGVDLLVDLPGRRKLTVVEIKTEKQEEFKKLVMPRAEHRVRTNLYLRTVEESGSIYKRIIDTQQARVLYVSKGGWGEKDPSICGWKIAGDGGWSPFKEFVVDRDDEATQTHYHRPARELHDFRNGGPIPGRIGACGTQFCRRAKGCPVVSACFSGSFPQGGRP